MNALSCARQRFGRHAAALLLATVSLTAMAIEEPPYRVLEHDGAFELRQYGPELLAETRVRADFDAAGGAAFRRLLGYISGDNRSRGKIPMTAPVTQVPSSPGDEFRVAFVMPAGYSEGTLPVPLDPSVQIRAIPGRLLATWRYSGRWTRTRYEEMERRLRAALPAHQLIAVGPPIFARYDAPFIPWPWRRNEVWIPVTRDSGPASGAVNGRPKSP